MFLHVYLKISRKTEAFFQNSFFVLKKLPHCVVIISFGELFITGLTKCDSSAALKGTVLRAQVPCCMRDAFYRVRERALSVLGVNCSNE